jgi:hypothetical protein
MIERQIAAATNNLRRMGHLDQQAGSLTASINPSRAHGTGCLLVEVAALGVISARSVAGAVIDHAL